MILSQCKLLPIREDNNDQKTKEFIHHSQFVIRYSLFAIRYSLFGIFNNPQGSPPIVTMQLLLFHHLVEHHAMHDYPA